MAIGSSDTCTLDARLERVEKQYRALKRSWIAVIALIVIGLGVMRGHAAQGQHPGGNETIEVQRIILKDKDGKPHGEITAIGGLPRVTLYDEKEANKVFVSPYFIQLNTPLRKISIDPNGLAIEMEGYGKMTLDYSKLFFVDSERKVRTALIPQSLSFYSRTSMPAVNLAIGEFGPSLQLEDSQGQTAILGGATAIAGEAKPRSAASLLLLDGEGKPIWRAPE
jgi:hypothetical protein